MNGWQRLVIQDSILEEVGHIRKIVVALLHTSGHGIKCECTICDAVTRAYTALEEAGREALFLDDEDEEEADRKRLTFGGGNP